MKKKTVIVFRPGRARLYRGKKCLGTLDYGSGNELMVKILILGLASTWTPVQRTLARRARTKHIRDQWRAMNRPLTSEAFRVQPRSPHIAVSPTIAKLDIADLGKLIVVRP